jgi:hypothetical protein
MSEPRDPSTASIELPRPEVTENNRFVMVPVTSDGEPPGGSAGSAGIYKVVVVLGVPGVESASTALDIDAIMRTGDSLIASGPLKIDLSGADEAVTWTFQSNSDGRLAHAEIEMHAEGLASAEEVAHDLVMQMLSRLAFETGAPIEAKAILVTEEATGTVSISTTLVGKIRTLKNIAGNMEPQLAAYLSAYREGLSSLTPLYQALSFYKVIEGISKHHVRASRVATKAGKPVPPDALAGCFPRNIDESEGISADVVKELVGRSLRDIWGGYADSVRNAAAHITPGKTSVVADRLADLSLCRKAVPVLRYIARCALEAELARA